MHHASQLCLAALALASLPSIASAYAWSSSGQWDTWTNNGYTVMVDAWGQVGEKVYANSGTNFWASAGYTGTSPWVKAYPHNQKNKNQSVSSYASNTGSISISGTVGAFDYAFDNWQPQETMVWNRWANTGPIGTLKYSNTSVGGRSWNIYNGGSNVTSFLAASQFSSGSVPIGTVMSWVSSHYGGTQISSIQYGVELVNGSGTWTVNNASYP